MEEAREGAHCAVRVLLTHLLVPVVMYSDLPLRIHVAIHRRDHVVLFLQAIGHSRGSLLFLLWFWLLLSVWAGLKVLLGHQQPHQKPCILVPVSRVNVYNTCHDLYFCGKPVAGARKALILPK